MNNTLRVGKTVKLSDVEKKIIDSYRENISKNFNEMLPEVLEKEVIAQGVPLTKEQTVVLTNLKND